GQSTHFQRLLGEISTYVTAIPQRIGCIFFFPPAFFPVFSAPLMIKVGLVSLGCAKNLIDSEIMVGHLQQAGMTMTPESELADVLIINTCSFIDMAKKESVGAIHDAVDAR